MTVKAIFQELRSNGFIRKSKRCRWSPFVANFKAGVLFRRTIFYNRKYDALDDDSLRFALLHEEGHHRGKQYSILILIVDMAVIISSTLLVTWNATLPREIIQRIFGGFSRSTYGSSSRRSRCLINTSTKTSSRPMHLPRGY